MDFFEHQEAARRQSVRLIGLFAIAVVLIVASVYLAVIALWGYFAVNGVAPSLPLWNPSIFFPVAAGTGSVIALGSLYKIASLRSGGGGAVAGLLGGRLLDRSARDADERRLLNVVEEMAIASGIPVPEVWVLDGEDGINAFAAGFSPEHAVIGVTRGCMKLLDRDELQGVIGHEFSHILNGDMRLNIRLMGVIHGILVIALVGRVMMRSSSRGGKKGNNQAALAGLALYLIGWVGVFFGRMIKAAVSRQREFLADASAVQFTRNPGGIAGALRKIGGLTQGARLETPHAEEASHLFIGNALGRSLFPLLSTHPPLSERISRIDPSFKGTFPIVDLTPLRAAPASAPPGGGRTAPVAAGAGAARHPSGTAGAGPGRTAAAVLAVPEAAAVSLQPSRAAARVGTLDQAHLEHARRLLDALGGDLLEHARAVPGAVGVIYALLLSRDEGVRARQLDLLGREEDAEVRDLVGRLSPRIDAAPAEARVPLVDLAVPSLRKLTADRFERFHARIGDLVAADRRVDLFELALCHAVRRQVAPQFGAARARVRRPPPPEEAAAAASVLLSALARAGGRGGSRRESDTPGAGEGGGKPPEFAAFEAGRRELGALADRALYLPAGECGVDRIERALADLDSCPPLLKRDLVAACTATVALDGHATLEEAELLRAVGHALDCPTPPFIPGVEI